MVPPTPARHRLRAAVAVALVALGTAVANPTATAAAVQTAIDGWAAKLQTIGTNAKSAERQLAFNQKLQDALEAEAIHIIREVVAEFERPAMLFSGGKDSVVMLHLAAKAFWPGRIPFPVVHVDTGHNFPEVLEFRDRRVAELVQSDSVFAPQELAIAPSLARAVEAGKLRVRNLIRAVLPARG